MRHMCRNNVGLNDLLANLAAYDAHLCNLQQPVLKELAMPNSKTLWRQETILQILRQKGAINVRELSTILGVSGWTIRRDLSELEKIQQIRRTHGRVELINGKAEQLEFDAQQNAEAKRAIGIATARLLKSHQVIVLGAGTTTTQVALALRGRTDISIMTNALNIALELSREPGIRVTCAGGDVHGDYFTLTGPVTERTLRAHYYDVAVVGVSGIDIAAGLTVNSHLNAVIIDVMLQHANRKIVVADSSKFGVISYASLAPLSSVDIIVTERMPDRAFQEHLRAVSTELVVAQQD